MIVFKRTAKKEVFHAKAYHPNLDITGSDLNSLSEILRIILRKGNDPAA